VGEIIRTFCCHPDFEFKSHPCG